MFFLYLLGTWFGLWLIVHFVLCKMKFDFGHNPAPIPWISIHSKVNELLFGEEWMIPKEYRGKYGKKA